MKIAILDAHTCDFDGLSWDRFASLGEVKVFPRTSEEEIITRSLDCQALIINKVKLDRARLAQLPQLRYVGVLATGVNNVDLEAARELAITVTNVPHYSTFAVAQMVFAHLLNIYSRVADFNRLVKDGAWSASRDFCLPAAGVSQLAGKILAIVGYGSIGKRVAAIAESFGMPVLVAAIPGRDYTIGELPERQPLRVVLQRADIVTLHCTLSRETENLINKSTLAQFKDGSILINAARGGLVNEKDLTQALAAGKLKAACLDVLNSEPPAAENSLIGAANAQITPHIAWAAREARELLLEEAFANLQAHLAGRNRNVVS